MTHRLKKFWLANGLQAVDRDQEATLRREKLAYYIVCAVALPFLVFVPLFIFQRETNPVEFWIYVTFTAYIAVLFTTATIKRDFKYRLRPYVVYAIPVSTFGLYYNLLKVGPSLPGMFGTIACTVFASALVRTRKEILAFSYFFVFVTALSVFANPTKEMIYYYLPTEIACLLFIGHMLWQRIHHETVRRANLDVMFNALSSWDNVISNANVIMAITDTAGTIVELSHKAEERAQAIGKSFTDFLAEAQRPAFAAAITRAKETKKAATFEVEIQTLAGEQLSLGATVWPILEQDTIIGFMYFVLDISAERQISKKMQQNLQFSVLGEMSAGIAHEIRNPLTVLSGNIDLLMSQVEKGVDPKTLLPRFLKLKVMTERINSIVNNVRRMYHSGEGEPIIQETVASIVDEATSFCAQKCLEKNISIEIEPFNPELRILCKPLSISQAILNLLHNSIDAISENPIKWIKLVVTENDEQVAISVVDSGKGLSEEVVSKIGESFFTTKEAGKGNGLGINLARRITEEHGGTFRYDPHSKNTKFDLIFPKKNKVELVA